MSRKGVAGHCHDDVTYALPELGESVSSAPQIVTMLFTWPWFTRRLGKAIGWLM
ncbi:MAG: hypothetical protein UZ03_NOB001000313 [Nitrospira sp. OLB3]|nr:MAG: hypothetical protein UZ03_NOB001000313 [Nitrospira sp. OLB3]